MAKIKTPSAKMPKAAPAPKMSKMKMPKAKSSTPKFKAPKESQAKLATVPPVKLTPAVETIKKRMKVK